MIEQVETEPPVNKPKKIAILVDTLHGGGAEKVCMALAKAMCALGAVVDLLVVKPLCEYNIDDQTSLVFLLNDKNAKLYKKKVINEAVHALREQVQAVGGYDLLLSNLDGAHPVAEKANLPNTWYVVHNSIDEKLKRAKRLGPIKYFRQKAIYNIFNGKNLVAVSQGLKDELQNSKHLKANKVELIYNPIDIAEIEKNISHDVKTLDFPYILHVGRFAKMKRHDTLFEAYRILTTTFAWRGKLVLLCDVSKKLHKLIKKYGLENDVILPGFQQAPYIWMKNAEALVLSSEGEGFGLVLVEAMLCGTPAVSTNCFHGPNEILTGKLSRYLSPVSDSKALAENIGRVIKEKPEVKSAEIFSHIEPKFAARKYLALVI